MSKINIDSKKIEELLSRSVDSVYPDKDSLKALLSSGKRISVYVGIDPTADYVHLGHSTNYLVLERLHNLGHKIIVLVGDFTAMIGDPSDKTSARVQLTRDEILKNLASFKEQIGKILNFNDEKNPIEFKFNSEWLSKLSFEKIVEIGSNFTVQQMLARDMFEKRIKENKPLFFHELFYPLMQGYDSVALEVDLEVGGTDQTFNMLTGRTLVKRYLEREKYVMTTTLLVNPATGEKLMSKSLGTGVGLNESAQSMFGKIMSLPDEGLIQTFVDCTRLSLSEIEEKKNRLKAGENPRNIKIELAREIVKMYHGKEEAEKAQEEFENVFSKRELPSEMEEVKIGKKEMPILDLLVEAKMVSSKAEAKRLVVQKAVELGGNTIEDWRKLVKVEKGMVLKVGKRKYAKIV